MPQAQPSATSDVFQEEEEEEEMLEETREELEQEDADELTLESGLEAEKALIRELRKRAADAEAAVVATRQTERAALPNGPCRSARLGRLVT